MNGLLVILLFIFGFDVAFGFLSSYTGKKLHSWLQGRTIDDQQYNKGRWLYGLVGGGFWLGLYALVFFASQWIKS